MLKCKSRGPAIPLFEGEGRPALPKRPKPTLDATPRDREPTRLPATSAAPADVLVHDSTSTKRHPGYYLEDGNVLLLTSDETLFRLHKSILLLRSKLFKTMFERPRPPPQLVDVDSLLVDGIPDEEPIRLDGDALVSIKDTELELICKVLYEMPLASSWELGIEPAVLLRTCKKLQFKAIGTKAIQMLETADVPPWDRYFLGLDCGVNNWILRSLLEICGAVESYPPGLLAKFASRGETVKLSKLLRIQQEYRSTLLIYSRGRLRLPYPVDSTYLSPACGECLTVLKSLLAKALSPDELTNLSRADGAKYPLLCDYLLKAFRSNSQNSSSICAVCRKKEEIILERVLGLKQLEREVGEGMGV